MHEIKNESVECEPVHFSSSADFLFSSSRHTRTHTFYIPQTDGIAAENS